MGAFDELGHDVQNELTVQLQLLIQAEAVHLFISGRHAAREYMLQLDAKTINVDSRPENDIRLYIHHMAEHPKTGRFYRGDNGKALQKEVADIVQQHAGGMFRWAELAFALSAESETSQDLRVRLQRLPQLENLFDIYDQIWKGKVLARSKPSIVAIQTTLLFTMYESPLHKQVLLYAMESRDLDYQSRSRYIATAADFASSNDVVTKILVQEIIDMCPEFLGIDSATIQLARNGLIPTDPENTWEGHKESLILPRASVREFLCERYPAQFGEAAGHRSLLEICLRTWNELPPVSPPQGSGDADWTTISSLLVYRTLYWIDHFLHDSQFVESVIDSMTKDPLFRKPILNLLGTADLQIASQWQTGFKQWRTRFHVTYNDQTTGSVGNYAVPSCLDRAVAYEFDAFEAHIADLRTVLIVQCDKIHYSAPRPEQNEVLLEIKRSLQDAADHEIASASARSLQDVADHEIASASARKPNSGLLSRVAALWYS